MNALMFSFHQFLTSSSYSAPAVYVAGAICIGWIGLYCFTNFIRPRLHPRNQRRG